ncbi:MDR family oxidoreductase [Mycoplana rhizolycopersici]|uniref:Oxidoreductase n=1 Tax=Mycoplana rhizolycopersici TaxID=2746702 RepID=A0ABX2Q7Q7_9HYPH|nr:MDR family oxidoreductase [Rhizobium rhizolycopersici]NVP53742.1 oxidoreductase [Rhizobium rhizolycopersici]
MTFRALLVDKGADGAISASVQDLPDERLPEGDVTVAVEYSTLNYKDGLCVAGKGGLVRAYPHVPGIDFSGTVEASADPRYRPGDKVILTGWRVGEIWWGGYATRAKVKGDWLVPLPEALTTRQAMAVGTAGLTAMLAVMALEKAGLSPPKGEVLVTGAAGGVGSVAVAILGRLGYSVAAVTGRTETADYLLGLGAETVIDRAELAEPSARPLESERWAAAVDAVGGDMLMRVLKQVKYDGAVAAIGLAASATIPSFTVIPFILRGVSLLGIDSVMRPRDERLDAWCRIGTDLPLEKLDDMITEYGLTDLPALAPAILDGKIRGRPVINVRR